MYKRSKAHPLRTAFFSLSLAAAIAPLASAQSNEVTMHQMQEHMQQMEQRLQEAEKRAASAETKVVDLQKQVNGTQLRAKEQAKKDAANSAAAVQAEQDYDKGNPKDFKALTLAPQNDKPYATLDINYFYMRTGAGTYATGGARESNDGRNTAFVNPLVSDNSAGRLGNELDTYLEPSFKVITNPFKDPNVTFGAVYTLSSYSAERTQVDLPSGFNTLDLYAFGKGVIPFLPGAEVWAGRRGYLFQFYMNIIDRRSYVIGGDGGGINDIDLGDFAKLDVAYLTSSPTGGSNTSVNPLNPLGSTYGDIRTDEGNLNKQSVFARLHDIELPVIGGKTSVFFQYQHVAGGTALVSGDFQGVPGGSLYNNLNYAGGIKLPAQDGFSGGIVHEYKHDFLNGDAKLSNRLFLGFGTGIAFDTTNVDKLRNSPYYNVSLDILQNNNNTVFTLADAHAYKFADQVNFYYKEKVEVEAYALYEHQDSGRPNVAITDPTLPLTAAGLPGSVKAKGIQNWVDIGVRPAYNFTPWFSLVAESTYNYIDNTAATAIRRAAGFDGGPGNLFKFTVAPTFHYGKEGNFPLELKCYYTFAYWNDNLKGSVVGGDPYRNSNHGHLFGTQAVLNF